MGTIHIIEIQYCPLCGKGLFRKYVHLEKTSFSFKSENPNVWKAKCLKCGVKITLDFNKNTNKTKTS